MPVLLHTTSDLLSQLLLDVKRQVMTNVDKGTWTAVHAY